MRDHPPTDHAVAGAERYIDETAIGHRAHVAQAREHLARQDRDLAPCGRAGDRVAAAIDKRLPEALLEVAELPPEQSLSRVVPGRGGRDAAGIDHSDEASQPIEREPMPIEEVDHNCGVPRRTKAVLATAREKSQAAGMTHSIFYSPKMVANPTSYSPSAAKPALVVKSWQLERLPIELIEPTPATVDELARAHDRSYVEAILDGRAANGFGERSPEVAASLPYTTGAMLSAARHAIERGGIACAPCSGFHHAGYAQPGAFCTFNGLMVTACALRAEGAARRVGILDCDMHYGNGTDEIIDRLDAQSWVVHHTAGAHYYEPAHASAFFAELPAIIESMRGCDVVLYQAGADPHIDDPLGGWLTTEELRRRDAMVFEGLRELGIPVAWNLAGGYQKAADGSIAAVIEIHTNTIREAERAGSRGRGPGTPPCRGSSVRHAFDAVFTQEVLAEVALHAQRQCTKYRWAIAWLSPEDLVQTVIVKTLEGRLRWKPEHRTLSRHLKASIDGEVIHALRHAYAFPQVAIDINEEGDAVVAEVASADVQIHQAKRAAEEAWNAALAALQAAAHGDMGVRTLLYAYESGARTQGEVMAMTGMRRREYAAAYSRLLYLARRTDHAIRRAA
jgi:acetoin utilization deacetylase AcuC-like enzyme